MPRELHVLPHLANRTPSFTDTHPARFGKEHVYKEHAHGLFKDRVFTPERWDAQQSWRRHIPSPEVTIRVILWYWPPLLVVSLIGVFVCLYHRFAQPAGAPDITNGNYTSPFLLSSFALSLLLVFRTNSSYDRWWEARKLWGGLSAITRNLVLEVHTYGNPDLRALQDTFARWVIMMPFALRAHLTREKDFTTGAEGVLTREEEAWLGLQPDLPVAVTQVLARIIPRLDLPLYMSAQTFEELANYQRTLASCERIIKQPIPIAYTRHTSRFLIVWICAFPFACFRDFGWFSPVVGTVVGFLLIGVENIGIQIEQPFSTLPLTGMAVYVKGNIMAMRKTCPASQAFVDEVILGEIPPNNDRAPKSGAVVSRWQAEGTGGLVERGVCSQDFDYEVPSERSNGSRSGSLNGSRHGTSGSRHGKRGPVTPRKGSATEL